MSTSPSPRSTPAPQLEPRATSPLANSAIALPPSAINETSPPASNTPISAVRPSLKTVGDEDGRRPSVQFVRHVTTDTATSRPTSRASSVQPSSGSKAFGLGAPAAPRRLSSPPPPAPFRPSVSFDTFSNKHASNFSLTLNRKHRSYEYTKRSRTFLCGTDMHEYSDTALEWLIEELVDDGDEVVCLRVVEKDSKEAVRWAGGMGEKGYRREAERFLEAIERKNSEDRAISLILEFAIGKVHDTIQHMIRIYEPALLVVGTRGRSLTGYQAILSSGSVSKYCLQYSPVPVIVVRPSSKREAKKTKRLRDPGRTGYRDILDKSEEAHGGRGGHLLDAQNRSSIMGSGLGALGELGSAHDPDHEARMVAEAIGYTGESNVPRPSSRDQRESSLSRIASAQSDGSDTRSIGGGGERVLKSPELANLDSPAMSEDEDEDEEEQRGRWAENVVRPEDEALALAYERAQKIMEEEQEEAEARAERQRERAMRGPPSRSRSRRRADEENEEGRGAAALGLLAQLDRGMR